MNRTEETNYDTAYDYIQWSKDRIEALEKEVEDLEATMQEQDKKIEDLKRVIDNIPG